MARGNQLLSEGNPEKAKVEFQHALRIRPADPQANLSLAKIEEAEGDIQASVPHYLRAAAPDARLLEAQLHVIEILIESARLSDALGRVNTTLGSFPDNADALALRADIYAQQNQTAPSRADAVASLQKDASNARALSVLATLALKSEDSAAALAYVNRGLAKHPDSIQLRQVEAAALLTANQPDKAIEALRSIVRTAPRNVALQVALAQLQAQTGKSAEAVASLQAAVAADPTNQDLQLAFIKFLAAQAPSQDVETYLNKLIAGTPSTGTYDLALAGFLQGENELEQSRAVLEKAIARLGTGPQADQIRIALARVDSAAGQSSLALAQLGTVLQSDPQNKSALLVRADMQMRSGRVASAVTDLESVVRQDPVNGHAFQMLASAYLLQGKTAMSIDAMKRAVAVIPGDDGAQIQLAAFLATAGDRTGARDIITRLTLQHPQSPAIWAVDAEFGLERKDWVAAERSIDRIRALPDGALTAMILEGELQNTRGNFAEAAKNYQAALTADPSQNTRLPGDFMRASLAAGQAPAAVTTLLGLVPSLKGKMQQQAWAALVTLQDRVGNYSGEKEAYQQLARLEPKQAEPYTLYVQNLVPRRAFEDAKQVADAGLAAGASASAMANLKGWIALSAGNSAEAQGFYKAAYDSDPTSLDAANNYASLLADLTPKDTEALAQVRSALNGGETSPNADIVDTIAWLDYRLGRFEEAKDLLNRINASQSPNPQVRFHLAATLIALGKKDEGLALLETTKGLTFPGSQEAQTLSAT
ncbi:tetratricopeptide repeat protein [Lichenihabitans sp. Uapishka_5]|uniref:tetratricopeptide repeat protein n=1 Tax=Lichenihabitans sp. Uapishka_5 TaxID=3037302 RepID=UPI0029E7FCF7|nr:tetratricopeptide repeat protein [Lichenihabitans sp. Uapishka_5]MDX7952062.1 tetratricopeptide repeat protein [Lichenihabitans sp. Uapishka_5]